MMTTEPDRKRRRLDRQFAAIARLSPRAGDHLRVLTTRGWFLVRLPLSILLVFGGFLSFLPILGFWMLPLGLLLLAVDLPLLQGPISALMIRLRRWIDLRRQRNR